MNPPFEKLQDIDHVKHAYKFLKPEGTLVAIMSPSGFFRSCSKAVEFQQWLEDIEAWHIDLPDNSFKASGTGVATKLLTVTRG